MTMDAPFAMELEEERIFVVYERQTGKVVHIHRVLNFRGAERSSNERDEGAALEHAVRFGHKEKRLSVLRVDSYDTQIPQRVDAKKLQLVASKPRRPASSRTQRKPSSQSAKRTRKTSRR
jgi:hypothetical protein